MPHLEMIRAAAEDLGSTQTLLNQRTQVLRDIIRTALDHGVSQAQAAESSGLTPTDIALIAAEQMPLVAF